RRSLQAGFVSSLARPTGNLTGFNLFVNETEAKRLELLHQSVPGAVRIAVLVNPANVPYTEATLREVGRRLGPSACKSRLLRPIRRVRSSKSLQRLGRSDPMRCLWGRPRS